MIEPEAPYEFEDHEIENNEGSWRDPTILLDSNSMRLLAQGSALNGGGRGAHFEQPNAPDRQPDDYWVLPPTSSLTELLGPRRQRLEEIRKSTSAYIEYNEQKNQIDIWGDREAIKKVRDSFKLIANQLEHREQARRKTRKWEKPERELTEQERRRRDKKLARQAEEKSFQGDPPAPQPFTASFIIPDQSLPIPRLVGEKEAYLNSLRAECKSYMWYDERLNAIIIAGQREESVCEAAQRIRNWYLKCSRRPLPHTLRLLQQPSTELGVRFRKERLPKGFVTYVYNTADKEEEKMLEEQRLMEAVVIGKPRSLIDLEDKAPMPIPGLSEHMQKLSLTGDGSPQQVTQLEISNREKLHRALEMGLESLRLFDWEIRMKIRFGQICLLDYPNLTKPISSEKLAKKYFPNPKFNSVLAPCIGKTREHMAPLFEYLSQHYDEFANSPQTSFAIQALQYPVFAPPSTGRREAPPPSRGDPWRTVITANFMADARVGLWNCLTDCTDLVKVNCTLLEGSYSWETKLEYARRLPTDNDTPHSRFVKSLSQNADSRIVLASAIDYQPEMVTQKTKRVFGKGNTVVEVIQDELWDMSKIPTKGRLQTDLSAYEPHRVIYKVALYKESWRNCFSENLTLRIGEAPSWTTRDFLETEEENAANIMALAKEFAEVLSKEVPVYWDQNSLI